jgi:hypothetical protein
MSETSSKKRKLSLPLVLAGGVSSLVLALGMSPTFSAFSASIQNTVNTTGTGALVMEETSGGVTCKSTDGAGGLSSIVAATCATINKYGGTTGTLLTPGGVGNTTTVVIKNSGSITPATFSLSPGACTQSNLGSSNGSATDLCGKINIKIYAAATATGIPIYNGTATAFTTALVLTPPAATTSASYTFVVSLDSTATNSYQGLQASQPLTWAFQS